MKKKLPNHLCIRLLSVLGMVVVLGIDLVAGHLCADTVYLGLLLSCSILLIYPCSNEPSALSLLLSVLVFVLVTVLYGFGVGTDRIVVTLFGILALMVAVKGWIKFYRTNKLFKAVAVWQGVEDYARFFYLILLIVLSQFGLHQLLVPVFFALYYRAWSGRTLFVGKRAESEIKDMVNGILRPDAFSTAPDKEMNGKYAQIQKLMVEDKRYLDPSLTMRDLCMATYSNRNYLSRTINVCSGRNFSRFVNYYRVMHSVELIDADPSLKVFELATMSGFANTVTFTSAFKDFMHESPGEYIRRKQSMNL